MKILYAGTLNPSGTCFSRMESLRELGPDVHPFDLDEWIDWESTGFVQRQFEQHLCWGPLIRRANRALLARCREVRPDMVWIDKGDWVQRPTLQAMGDQGCFLVHHVTDSLHTRGRRYWLKRRLLRATLPDYDVFFTTNIDDHAGLLGNEPPKALLTHLGHDHRRFDGTPLTPEQHEKWDRDLLFVGHYEPETEEWILALIDAGLPVTVHGLPPWFRSKHRQRLGDRLFPGLGGDDYVHALKGAKIGLCFVSVMNYNQTASRSCEIPACGTMLLAIRTPQHSEMYEEGVEAEFFGSREELIEKARYYLEHDEEREAIARRGQERAERSGYSWDALMRRDWPRLLEIYEASRG